MNLKLLGFLSFLILVFPLLNLAALAKSSSEVLDSKHNEDLISHEDISNLNKFAVFLNIGFPVPATLGIQYFLNTNISGFISAGYFPMPTIGQFNYSSGHLEFWTRWHPFSGPFFIGGILGYQSLQIKTKVDFSAFSSNLGVVDSIIGLNSFYIGFGLGFSWKIGSRLYLGFDIGIQNPIYAVGGITINGTSQATQDFQNAAENAFTYFAYYVLPKINLLRIGLEF